MFQTALRVVFSLPWVMLLLTSLIVILLKVKRFQALYIINFVYSGRLEKSLLKDVEVNKAKKEHFFPLRRRKTQKFAHQSKFRPTMH